MDFTVISDDGFLFAQPNTETISESFGIASKIFISNEKFAWIKKSFQNKSNFCMKSHLIAGERTGNKINTKNTFSGNKRNIQDLIYD